MGFCRRVLPHNPSDFFNTIGAKPTFRSRMFSKINRRSNDNARDGDGRALEADLLPQLQAPDTQAAVRLGARQDHGRGFVEQTSQVGVAASRDMAVIVDLAGLVASRRQTQPRAHGTRRLEVRRILDRGGEGCGGDRADARDRHQQLA